MGQDKIETAVFGGGCFWCTEAIFLNLKRALAVMPGYTGGTIERPSYDQVCSGAMGHAEVVRVEYDPTVISYSDLLQALFATHDPTTVNRQGGDVGTQYRSVIFTTSQEQSAEAQKVIAELNASGDFAAPIVTEIKPLENFYEAEESHRNYYQNNPTAGYCQAVISPKLAKLHSNYAHF
ncbi:MAG TPA: peptide-methionine (S)-S-oxide reductase MsrA [Candidatus Paceibacterota bacterium]|nr:peptide-methionine (S)-S-oxide reductase MsrA [Candidatus Paceibacterota bacterium]